MFKACRTAAASLHGIAAPIQEIHEPRLHTHLKELIQDLAQLYICIVLFFLFLRSVCRLPQAVDRVTND
ncbi:hypothetical protein E2C01_018062 [Portunus trituberculatus]|uniref:Uncharacterized protein n=1 Tax=Portunus trituberculatus TaxID=210409 RepID=A0A5B7DU51_PORTR|nr:hypothetical protein [Portunus trituberculatus]